ncbi:hypothetical protein C8R43DRAFT_1134464 [Mycena crocata]|nr:hypothetical protein C8R43DRAFT_1134464 [Mycena crocata]
MSIVLNLGLSHNRQKIDLLSMVFPAEMVDWMVYHVRVYGERNIGCNPSDFRNDGLYRQAYVVVFEPESHAMGVGEKPKNSLYDGC